MNWLQRRRLIASYNDGRIFAYPTEAVYGLGVNPFDAMAVESLFQLKQRSPSKKMIVVASSVSQLALFLSELDAAALDKLSKSWPGPMTWVVPVRLQTELPWLVGVDESIALRVSSHPVVQEICQLLGPVVSTSANMSGLPPCKTATQVRKQFRDSIDCIIEGACSGLARPTPIRDLVTDEVLRN